MPRRFDIICIGFGALLLLPFSLAAMEPSNGIKLTSSDQESLELTIYDSFGVVRDTRRTILPNGDIEIEFQHVAQLVDPASVRVRSVRNPEQFVVREQSYQFDLLNKETLLKRYLGSKLKYSRNVLEGATYEKVLREGILLSIDPEIVKFGDEVEISPEGVISLPFVPAGLRTIPTLVWRVDNQNRGEQLIETSYVTEGLSWDLDYLLDLDPTGKRFSLMAWVNVTNRSGVAYSRAVVKLIAGDVNRVQPKMMADAAPMMMRAESMPMAEPLSDYHAYRLPEQVTLRQNESRQLRLMSKSGIAINRQYVSTFNVMNHQMPQAVSSQFDVRMGFVNTDGNGLGVPLPAGRVRVFSAASTAPPELLGEDHLAAVPVGERAEFTIGRAFDLIAERTQTQWRRIGERVIEVSYDVSLRNRKTEPVTLVLHEKIQGDWSVSSQTGSGQKIDSSTLEYIAEMPPGSQRTISYTVRIGF